MNTFKKLNDKPILNEANFPILINKEKNTSSDSLNYLNVMNKKINRPELIEKENNTNNGFCTIYYDKELKKMIYENFPNKTYYDSDTDSENYSETDSIDLESSINKNIKNSEQQQQQQQQTEKTTNSVKNMKIHNDMNRAIKIIMENRDRFIDRYGVDEYIREYLPRDSPYLYSRYYYKNKYMNYNKKKANVINTNNNYTNHNKQIFQLQL